MIINKYNFFCTIQRLSCITLKNVFSIAHCILKKSFPITSRNNVIERSQHNLIQNYLETYIGHRHWRPVEAGKKLA